MRNRSCGEINGQCAGQSLSAGGWVASLRDHGGVIFIDLRDATGVLQVVVDPHATVAFEAAGSLSIESVIEVAGTVRRRPEGTANEGLKSGAVELVAERLVILNLASALPFQLGDEVSEELRLRFRYLDLRTARMQGNLRKRHLVTRTIRGFLDARGFVDVETPMLTRSTPEGARDYLVPSRLYKGRFFSLPQSPQLFKQLLMMGGIESYYQISRCFRDEDLRADRQPEFTQVDVEMSFMTQEQIMLVMEEMIRHLFATVLEVKLPALMRVRYAECLSRFGTDRPDTRIDGLELVDVDDLVDTSHFRVFADRARDPCGRVAAMLVRDGCRLTRKEIDEYTEYVSSHGAKGLAYIKVNSVEAGMEGLQSPIVKFIGAAATKIVRRLGARAGDLIFFGADRATVVNESLSALRARLAIDLGRLKRDWGALWVTDFPMFSRDQKSGRLTAVHHPFTAPAHSVTEVGTCSDKTHLLSQAYDMVINGVEVGGGSIRIHQPEMQMLVFALLGMDSSTAKAKFGPLIDALGYGCPPHGGMAFGLDRLVMLMRGESSIRNVIAFPKTQSSSCPLMMAPDVVESDQLDGLLPRSS